MKRFISILLTLALLAGLVSAGAEKTSAVSYDFNVRFHLEEQEVPYRMRERIQGYRDLLEALELKGNVVWDPETSCMDIRLTAVPANNPSAAVSLRIFGRHSSICVESPLLGEEPYYLGQTSRIMGFFSQLWVTLGIPFPAFFLLDPYLIPYSLKSIKNDWDEAFREMSDGQVIKAAQLEKLRDAWREDLQTNSKVKTWLNSFYCLTENSEPVERAVAILPETLLNAAGGGDLTIRNTDGIVRCENAAGESIFEIRNGEQFYSVEVNPPDTGAEYRPYFRFSRNHENGTKSIEVKADWSRPEIMAQGGERQPENGGELSGTDEYEDEGDYGNPASMLQFSLKTDGIPSSWPADGVMTADLSMGGYVLPEAKLQFLLETAPDGSAKLTVTELPEEGQPRKWLTCSGSVTQKPYKGELYYEYADLFDYTLLLVATHDWATEALGRIVPNMAKGLINFVSELPVRSCQVLLDDLENLGLLGAVLAGN